MLVVSTTSFRAFVACQGRRDFLLGRSFFPRSVLIFIHRFRVFQFPLLRLYCFGKKANILWYIHCKQQQSCYAIPMNILAHKENRFLCKVIFLGETLSEKTNPKNLIDFIVIESKKFHSSLGFSSTKRVREFFESEIFGHRLPNFVPPYSLGCKKIVEIVNNTLEQCQQFFPVLKKCTVFVCPSFNFFVKNRMGGISGYSPRGGVILLGVCPTGWSKQFLRDTVAHEFNHSIFFGYHKCETLLDSIIFEGLAEHFREAALGGKPAPWSRILAMIQAKKLLLELNDILDSKDDEPYQKVFFGRAKYPLWAGYSIGYHIVGSFLRAHAKLEWKEIIKFSPRDILTQSKFI